MTVTRRRSRSALRPAIKAWSFSRWKVWELCPQKAHFKFNERRPEPEGAALIRGKTVHDAGERYLSVERKPRAVPPGYELFASELAELRRDKAAAEVEIAFDRGWRPVGWFDDAAWCRVKIDALATSKRRARVVDFKTGRERPDHLEQLELYALALLKLDSRLEEVHVELWYLDSGEVVEADYARAEEDRLEDAWEARLRAMLADRRFPARPGSHCRFCPYSHQKGGPCEH